MHPAAIDGMSEAPNRGAERRRHPRVVGSFSAKVRGVNARGEGFAADAELKDLSGGGFYLRLAERVEPGAALEAEISLSGGTTGASRFTASGRVVRSEPLIDGRCGAAVAFNDIQFLS